VQFLGPDADTVLSCHLHDLYDGQRMHPEKLAAWQALRERYGNRDESRVDRGTRCQHRGIGRGRQLSWIWPVRSTRLGGWDDEMRR
jgi:hypothetical protein